MNGTEPMIMPHLSAAKEMLGAGEPQRRTLTNAQQKQLLRLVNTLGRAQEAFDGAQRHLETSQQNANDFLVYCAEEAGIVLGQDGWSFDQGQLLFIKQSAGEGAEEV